MCPNKQTSSKSKKFIKKKNVENVTVLSTAARFQWRTNQPINKQNNFVSFSQNHHRIFEDLSKKSHLLNSNFILSNNPQIQWLVASSYFVFMIVYLLFIQPQHEHMERHKKRFGVRMDKMERDRKREARKAHKISEFAQKSFGWRAKMFNQKRFKEKAAMRKTLNLHQEGSNKHANDDNVSDGDLLHFILSHYLFLIVVDYRCCACLSA
jgi:ATP-dependent phosphoenolpyruvate carboxykinase